MQIKSILASQAIRFFSEAPETIAERRSPIPLIRGMQDRYGFIQVPSTLAELDFTTGVTFLRGYYRNVIINKLQVYENGILCDAATDNGICDEFLGDVLSWATAEHSIPIKQSGVKAFISQLEIVCTIDLDKTLAKLNAAGAMVAELLRGYGQPVTPYQMSGFKLHYDSVAAPVPRPPEFVFERRVGQPYGIREYFSSAPLRTGDHVRLLNLLEATLMAD